MQPHEVAGQNGRPATRLRPNGARLGSEELRAACERQAHVIETLTAAVATLRGGSAALKAENAELRAAAGRIHRATRAGVSDREDATEVLEASLPLDARAPSAARLVVARLRGRVPAPVLDTAQLVVSELVTNSVRHSGASAGESVVVRAQLTDSMVRLEVSDPGCDGVIAPREPDLEGGGGFGLNVVRTCSERWGLERVAAGGTRVWAQLARTTAAPVAGPESSTRADAHEDDPPPDN
jgi:anti-sigma regulatory factor (Ser/Thr protein kinase)